MLIFFLICIPIPVKNDSTHITRKKTRMEIDRGLILHRSGKPFYAGTLYFGNFLTISTCLQKNGIRKQTLFKIDSRQTPPYNILELTVGSRHGFGKTQILSLYLQRNYSVCYISMLSFLLVKVSILLICHPIGK